MAKAKQHKLIELVCVSDALVQEVKRIIKESEILKYASITLGREEHMR